jgi:tetratricopeptide (TPR) repeat protein
VLSYQGRVQEALPLAEWAVQAARGSRAEYLVLASFVTGARARLAVGDQDGARSLLGEVDQTPHIRGVFFESYLPDMVRIAVATDDLALAERATSRFDPVLPYREHALVAAQAILAEARGETDEASTLYAEAAQRWERFGVVPEQAFALLGQGRCLVALGRAAEAAEPLREAREIFIRLGAVPALGETAALLAQATTLTS